MSSIIVLKLQLLINLGWGYADPQEVIKIISECCSRYPDLLYREFPRDLSITYMLIGSHNPIPHLILISFYFFLYPNKFLSSLNRYPFQPQLIKYSCLFLYYVYTYVHTFLDLIKLGLIEIRDECGLVFNDELLLTENITIYLKLWPVQLKLEELFPGIIEFFNSIKSPSNSTSRNTFHETTFFVFQTVTILLKPTELFNSYIKIFFINIKKLYTRFIGLTFYYFQGFVFLLFVDTCLADDEPLWEPIEWSLVQTWILFIFLFGWIAENLIASRYGNYVGKDKRVWMAWYKTFWLVEIYYVFNFLIVACFIIVPFYFEINYSMTLLYSWWNWYTRVFFLKFTSTLSVVLVLSCVMQKYIRWWNWKKLLVVTALINMFLSYLIYTHFIMSFFGYFTDPIWFTKNKSVDYIQLSHEPSKWGFKRPSVRDGNFTYHTCKTVFWFKNDGPIASAFLIFHLYFFLSIFFIYIYWISLFRRIYSTREVPLTYVTYCVSALKQFIYCSLMLYFFVILSFIFQYWRLPIEVYYRWDNKSWLGNVIDIMIDVVYTIDCTIDNFNFL